MDENAQMRSDDLTIEEIKSDDSRGDIENSSHTNHHHHHHSSDHRHHHGHHHHHRKHSSKKKPNKLTAFCKKYKSILINILSCTVSVVLLIILAVNFDVYQPNVAENSSTDITKSTIKIETSVYTEKISLVSNAVSYYMDPNNDLSANEVYKSFNDHKGGLNIGLPLNFSYRVTGLPSGVKAISAELEISENNNYQESLIYKLDLNATSIDIYNLKTGMYYYYRLNLTLTDDCVIGTTGTFETETTPRILNIDGAVNVRDIGGWQVETGKTIRQGLLYRGSEIDGAVESEYAITDKGLQQMIGELGVRFDMDLRSSTDNKDGTDALGKNVLHKYYNASMYSDILNDNSKETVRSIFSDLADPDNYPIYLHCTYGRDRTGTICYLLEALLGMSDEDLYKEYELSALTDSYVNTEEFNVFIARINAFEGKTTKEKVEGYLLSIGVTAEEIASIREIFLGK